MVPRLILGSLLLLGAAAAQSPTPPLPPVTPPVPTGQPPAQDPDKPKPTPESELAELAKEKARLEREIQYVKERAKNSKQMLADKLRSPDQSYRSIDAGVTKAPIAPPPTPRYARLATGDEMASFPADTMLLVNGRPIGRSVFDLVMAHMKLAPGAEPENLRAQRVLYDLVATEAMSAHFGESEAETVLGDVLTQLDKGTSMQELAKKHGSVGATPDGRFEATRNSGLGPRFEQIAFETKPGTRARPFRNSRGIVVLQVDSFEKGETPELDKVIGTAIQISHSSDPGTLAKAQQSIHLAQMDIIVRDADVMALLPRQWKQPEAAAAPTMAAADLAGLREAMARIQVEIDKLAASTEAGTQERRTMLETQLVQIKEAIKRTEAGVVEVTDEVPPPKKQDPTPPKKD
ncbi:MAG TPA: peptidylprolyl isomerase [Planctomycetota bacterium]